MKNQAMAEKLGRFIAEQGGRVHDAAFRLCGDREEAKELVQEALYRAVQSWNKYDESRPLDAWLFIILRNAFFDSQGRTERRNIVSLDRDIEDDEASYAEIISDGEEPIMRRMERQEAAIAVQRVLNKINAHYRTILMMCDMDGTEQRKAADSIGVSVNTVRSRLFRARRALRRHLPRLAVLVN